jgi:hypothetical protein
MSGRRLALAVCALGAILGPARGVCAEWNWSLRAQSAVHSVRALGPAQKQSLTEAVVEVYDANQVSADAPDKQAHVEENVLSYLNALVPTGGVEEEELALIREEFEWALWNYANLPVLTPEQRREGINRAARVREIALGYAADLAGGLPQGLRDHFLRDCSASWDELVTGRVGSYFVLEFLYPAEATLPDADVLAALRAAYPPEQFREACAPFVTPGTPGLREDLTGPQQDALLRCEATGLTNAAADVLSRLFTQEPSRNRCVAMSRETVEARFSQYEQRVRDAAGRWEESIRSLAAATEGEVLGEQGEDGRP